MKQLVRLLVLLVMVTAVYAGTRFNHYTESITLSVTTAGDTAQAMRFWPVAKDSCFYSDSVSYGADTTGHKTISWTSPVQQTRLTVVVDTTKTYVCTLDCGTNAYTWSYACPETALTVAQLIDRIVVKIDSVGGMKDTIDAVDSTTFIQINSRFAQDSLEGDARWRMGVGPAGFFDTAATWVGKWATVAMICDTLVAKINADDSLSKYMTAVDVTTHYTLTSDDAGVLFYAQPADSVQLDTVVQANVVSRSAATDTFAIDQFKQMSWNAKGLYGRFIIGNPDISTQGIGLADSGYMRLYSVFGGDQWDIIAACSTATLPCTLKVSKPSSLAGVDSLLKGDMYLWTKIADTASDTTATVTYKLKIDYEMTVER